MKFTEKSDVVLRYYAKGVLSTFRHHDLVARYGGEEFAVLLPNIGQMGVRRALWKRCAGVSRIFLPS